MIGLAALATACSHPLEITGEGDILSQTGNRDCLLEDYVTGEDNCAKNVVIAGYSETYFAQPRSGWLFDRWENYCQRVPNSQCSFQVPSTLVQDYWFQTLPPLRAVFVRDTACNAVFGDATLVDTPYGFGNGTTATADPQISANGSCLYWVDQQNLDGSATDFTLDTNTNLSEEQYATRDIFLMNTRTGQLARVTDPGADNLNTSQNIESVSPAISTDGLKVAYVRERIGSGTSAGFTRGDVFVRDMSAPASAPVQVNITTAGLGGDAGTPIENDDRGSNPANRGTSSLPVIDLSGDGNRVVFITNTGLAGNDSNGNNDVYLRDIAAGTTTLISTLNGQATGTTATTVKITEDGRYVAFSSGESYIGGEQGVTFFESIDIYLVDTTNGRVLLVSSPVGGNNSGFDLSSDGSRIAFATEEPIAADDTNAKRDIYVADIDLNAFSVVSRQRVSESDARFQTFDGDSYAPVISPSGDRVVFLSLARDLVPYRAELVDASNAAREQLYSIDLSSGVLSRPDVQAALDGQPSDIAHAALTDDTLYYRRQVDATANTGASTSDQISPANIIPATTGEELTNAIFGSNDRQIDVGMSIRSNIDSASDEDVLQLPASSQQETIYLVVGGVDGNTGTLPDPELRLFRGSSDNPIATDSNSGFGRDAFLSFTREAGATYFIQVRSQDGAIGSYRLLVSREDDTIDTYVSPSSDEFMF